MYLGLGRFDEARADFEKYLVKHPESRLALYRYGMAHVYTNEAQTALEIFEVAKQQPETEVRSQENAH